MPDRNRHARPACPRFAPGPRVRFRRASESGTTVTITMTTANPANLIVGDKVTIANVSVAGYNGNFTVTAIPQRHHVPIHRRVRIDRRHRVERPRPTPRQCGMVDQGAALIPNDGGKVLLAGGDLVTFLGQASNLSFIFDPATQTFSTDQRIAGHSARIVPAGSDGSVGGHRTAVRRRGRVRRHRREFERLHRAEHR